jgi:hypothetical protein
MEWQFSHTLVLGLELAPRAGIYLEYLGVATEGPYHRFFSGGATYAVSPTVQLNVGGLIGLNEAAEDLTLFSGISWKF